VSWRIFLTDGMQVPGLRPLSLSWDAIGGPDKAILALENEAIGFESIRSRLGSGVEIYDPSDRLAWWGYLNSVHQPLGSTGVESSLEDLANRVAVRYRSMEPGRDFGAPAQTDWKDDLASQATYGVKEMLLRRDLMSDQQALQLRDVSLTRMAQPESKLLPSIKTQRSQLECRGWFERLAWRQWPSHSDILGHSPSQLGFQSFGATLTQKSLAQSCVFSKAVKIASVSVRIRKIAQPVDQVRFQLQTDAPGQPSGVVLSEGVLAASAIPAESYAWVSVWFANPCAIAAGERIWLVIARDGAPSSVSYFSLGLDENLGFPGGKLLLQDASLNQWKARTPDADLLFKLTALSDSVDLMAQIVQESGVFTGFSYEASQGFSLPYVSSAGTDCRAAFLELLGMGTPGMNNLLAEVSPKRRLRVFPQPAPANQHYWLGEDGRIRNELGKNLAAPWQAVGNWLTSETGTTCYLQNLNLDFSDVYYKIDTKNTT